ncbi:MAG TPA: glycoside hydrolase family 88 protein, partial [Candidatus Eisenbacteria bacterium]|nr:glycoside hydrolase family 88 protein [Candidatus Eisenbacteria bacterium]
MKRWLLSFVLLAAVLWLRPALVAQNVPFNAEAERAAAGDQPDDPGPLARDLSPKLKRPAIQKAMKKVADWQLKQSEGR